MGTASVRYAVLAAALLAAGCTAGAADEPTQTRPPEPTSTASEALDEWYVLPIRSATEWRRFTATGSLYDIGGEGVQHNHAITRSPNQPARIYLAGDVHQVRRSDDGGRSWRSPRNKGLLVPNTYAIAVDPVDPDVVLVHADAGTDYTSGDDEGLYRSADGGESWRRVLPIEGWSTEDRTSAHKYLTADPRISRRTGEGAVTWYAVIDDEGERDEVTLYSSDDYGLSWSDRADLTSAGVRDVLAVAAVPVGTEQEDLLLVLAAENGVWLSSDEGGTFEQAPLQGVPEGASIDDLSVVSGEADRFYLVADGTLFETRDRGATVDPVALRLEAGGSLDDQDDVDRVFTHPSRPDVLFAVLRQNGIVQSTDAGLTWSPGRVVKSTGVFAGYHDDIRGSFTEVAPHPDIESEAVAFSRSTVWRTEDAGATWRTSAALYAGITWGSKHAIYFDPEDPQRLSMFANDVGSVHSVDAGRSFEVMTYEDTEYPNNWFSSGDVRPDSQGQEVVISTRGGKYAATTDGGRSWTTIDEVQVANPAVSHFHRQDPSVVYAGRKISRNGGQSWEDLNNGQYVLDVTDSDNDVVFSAYPDMDSSTVFRSTNAGRTWTDLFPEGLSESSGGLVRNLRGHDSFLTFAADPADPNIFYTKTKNGDAIRYDHATGTWTQLGIITRTDNDGLKIYVRHIQADPQDVKILYAGVKNTGRGIIYRSLDRGRTWEDISKNLPRNGLSPGFAVHPLTGDVFFGGGSGLGTWVHPRPERHPSDWPSFVESSCLAHYSRQGPLTVSTGCWTGPR